MKLTYINVKIRQIQNINNAEKRVNSMRIINWEEFLLPYEQAVNELRLKLEAVAHQYKVVKKHCPISQVESRVKSVGSIIAKMNKKGISMDDIEEGIDDIAGVRVICRFVEDIERVLDLLKKRESFDLKILQEKDYINNTKPSGYRSYHVVIEYPVMTHEGVKNLKAEIQIRTMAMNFWATIEHSLKYKYNGNIPEAVQQRLITSAEAAFNLDKEVSTIRDEITEAQKIVKIVDETVEEILSNLQGLYGSAKLDNINELNKKFIEVYQLEDVDKLLNFAEQVRVIGDIYKSRYYKE